MSDENNNNVTPEDFAADLEQFDEEFKNSKVEKKGDVPDGTYTVFVEKAELKKTKLTKENMFSLTMRIIEGKQKNRMLFKNSVLNNADRVKYLKTDLATMEIMLEKLSELPSRLKDILDLKLIVQQKTTEKGDKVYVNAYINKSLGKIDEADKPTKSSNDTGDNEFSDDDFTDDSDLPF